MVQRGPVDGDDGATRAYPPPRSRTRRTSSDDGDTVILPAVRASRPRVDDDATQVITPVRMKAAGPRPVGNRAPGTRPATRMPDPAAERRSHRKAPSTKRHRVRGFVKVTVIVLVLLLAGVGGLFFGYQHKIAAQINKFSLGTIENRPVAAVPEAVNILLVGSDSRLSKGEPAGGWQEGEQRADSLMLVHIAENRKSVDVVSIPRDSWVDIPNEGKAKVNSAYTYGGPERLILTVEALSGVRIDHMVVADFTGFKEMTDAVGGVEITVPVATGDSRNWFEAGTHRMSGKQALGYVRQRHNLPNGDFDRVKRQQNWIRAVIKEALSRDTLTSPVELNNFLNALSKAVSVDDQFDIGTMRNLALSLRSMRADDIRFMTMPTLGTGMEEGQSIVYVDETKATSLFAAMANDQMSGWLEVNKPELLEAVPR
jgi:LCP family protein required for cell wall assembly